MGPNVGQVLFVILNAGKNLFNHRFRFAQCDDQTYLSGIQPHFFRTVFYLITSNFLPILIKAAIARSSCSRVWAADNWMRMRAWPFGTTG